MRALTKSSTSFMLYLCVLVVALLSALAPVAYSHSHIFESHSLKINQSISAKIDIENSHYLNWLEANFSFLPVVDFRQNILSTNYDPQPYKREEDYVVFRFKKPGRHETYISQNVVQTYSDYKQVTGKVNYPVASQDVSKVARAYLDQTELIDINSEIRDLAREIAGESDDLFEVSFRLADWVTTNIDYDLNTITADASQKATWVLDTRSGVCDELSTLYLALMRSLGIPARFVVGVSFSNSDLFAVPWQAHAWTEVFFPDYGWVPFDLTYKQFGYIDASHIKLKTSNDADETTTYYRWEGSSLRAVDVSLNELDFSQDILEFSGTVEEVIVSEATIITTQLGSGSWGLLELRLENTKPHYASNTFYISTAVELSLESKEIPILLRPLQQTYVYVPFQITNDLRANTQYSIPLIINDLRGQSQVVSVTAHDKYQVYTKEQIIQEENIAKTLHATSELIDVSIGCRADSYPIFVNTTVDIICDVEGVTGATRVCLFDTCQTEFVEQERPFIFSINTTSVGELSSVVELFKDSHVMASRVTFPVVDHGLISIQNLTFAKQLSYGDTLNLSFSIVKESFADPTNVRVGLQSDVPSSWNIGVLTSLREFRLKLASDQLYPGENKMSIVVEYFDGESHQRIVEPVVVELIDVPFPTRIWLWILYVLR